MNCTGCQNPMITAELDEVEVDFCPQCGGIWLDAGEMELLLGDTGKTVLDSFSPARKCREKAKRCPICRRRMNKVRAGAGEEAVLLDRCPKGDGLWFDRGELDQIIRSAKFDSAGRVIAHLESLFKSTKS